MLIYFRIWCYLPWSATKVCSPKTWPQQEPLWQVERPWLAELPSWSQPVSGYNEKNSYHWALKKCLTVKNRNISKYYAVVGDHHPLFNHVQSKYKSIQKFYSQIITIHRNTVIVLLEQGTPFSSHLFTILDKHVVKTHCSPSLGWAHILTRSSNIKNNTKFTENFSELNQNCSELFAFVFNGLEESSMDMDGYWMILTYTWSIMIVYDILSKLNNCKVL